LLAPANRVVKSLKLPEVMFHALRHSRASALIASGLDVLTVSRRLGHGNPTVTLTTYAHLFEKTDAAAAKASRLLCEQRSNGDLEFGCQSGANFVFQPLASDAK
jgi:Phage integrase family